MKNRLLTLAGALVLLAILGRFYAKPLLAQVRAALVQNVDEPGRNPFTLIAQPNAPFVTWTVPAGKRYVIEQFSAECNVPAGFALLSVNIGVTTADGNGLLGFASAPPILQSAAPSYSAASPVRLYADPGSEIRMNVENTGTVSLSCFFFATGYAISLP